MSMYHVEVTLKKQYRDRHGEHVRQEANDAGVKQVRAVSTALLYRFEGDLSEADLRLIADRLLIDPVTEEYRLYAGPFPARAGAKSVQVWLKPGVTDTVAESVAKAIGDLGVVQKVTIKTGHLFAFSGAVGMPALRMLVERLLVNTIVQEYTVQ